MAFCKYSVDMLANNTTEVDNIFINNYLPYADAKYVKVYLYGLYKCQDSNSPDNTLEHFAKELRMSEENIESAFSYWQEQGLVQLLSVIPFEVRYLPMRDIIHDVKRYSKTKYANFNAQIQEILNGRMLTPHEYNEYYDIIERLHVEKEGLINIINYCARLKGNNVGANYIYTVARSWASQGLTSTRQIKEKIAEMDTLDSCMEEFVKIAKLKRGLTLEEYELFKKWTVEQGFEMDVVNFTARKFVGKQLSLLHAVDKQLEKYYSQKLFDLESIKVFEEEKKKVLQLARDIVKNLGLWYENIDPVIDNYVLTWTNLGFSAKMLEEISNYCFKTNVRTLEGMNRILEKFHKLGILTEQALAEYFSSVISVDKKIKTILENIGLSRNVNQFDRDKYKVWKEIWKMPDEVIEYACTLAVGKDQPMQYFSSIISTFHDKNITTVEDAKKSFDIINPKTAKSSFSTGRSYTKEEMNSLFQSIDEIEI